MFKWKVEDMKLLEETKKGGVFVNDERIFSCEIELSREEKIEFVDKLYDGNLSYILELCEKFEKEKEELKKDQWGSIKTNSLKAWIKRNDNKNLIDNDYTTGKIYIGTLYSGRWITHDPLNTKQQYDFYDDLVDECFHRVLKECLKKEQKYFKEHDEKEIMKTRVRDYQRKYDTSFGVDFWEDGGNNRIFLRKDRAERDLTEDELKDLISKYEQIDSLIQKLIDETHILF